MLRCRATIPVFLMGLLAAGSVRAQTVTLSAVHPLDTDCGTLPNTWPQLPGTYLYFPGLTAHWAITVDLARSTEVRGGVVEFRPKGDWLRLLCDPATHTLPGTSYVLVCTDFGGPPSDGFIRIENITVPAMTPVTILLQTEVLASTPLWTTMTETALFTSTATGTINSNSASILVRPPVPAPVTTVKTVSDVNGGAVLPGDELQYALNINYAGCFGFTKEPVHLIDTLPPELQFVRIDNCFSNPAFTNCWYDPVLRQVHVDSYQPERSIDDETARFTVRLAPTASAGVEICNQALANGWELSDDDPFDATPDAPTCIRVDGSGSSLAITKTMVDLGNGNRFLDVGEAVRFEITVSNGGDQAANNVRVRDVLPAGLAGFDPAAVAVSIASGANASTAAPSGAGSGIMDWTGLQVPPFTSITITFTATATASAASPLCNSAELTSGTRVLASDDPATGVLGDATCMAVLRPGLPPTDCAVRELAGGQYHTVALKLDGTLSVWGDNFYGQLGDGSFSDRLRPTSVGLALPVIDVAGGLRHTLAVTNDGKVWAWGDNAWGELGNATFANYSVPVEIPGFGNVAAVAAGYMHSLAVKSDGTVWAWGYNSRGQLGTGGTSSSAVPVQVPGLANCVAVAAGAWSSMALDASGRVWTWGDNFYGQLGDGTFTRQLSPQRLNTPTGIRQISGKGYHALALENAGGVWAWGFAETGQLGTGSTTSTSTPARLFIAAVDSIDTGATHSLALVGGALWVWGDNARGQLGTGSGGCICEIPQPLSIPPPPVCDQAGTPVLVPGIVNLQFMAAGGEHTVAVQPDTTMYSWGRNSEGQLGTQSRSCSIQPIVSVGTCSVSIEVDPARPAAPSDSCATMAGNMDGQNEPGERVSIDLGIRNVGGTAADGFPLILAVLRPPAPAGVVYVQDRIDYLPSPLPAGSSGTPSGPFVIDLDPAIACPSDVFLTIDIVTLQGSFPIDVTIPVGPSCVEACVPADCQPNLRKIAQLKMVRQGGAPHLYWDVELSALTGYRAYGVDSKTLIPFANLAATPRQLECETLATPANDCVASTPVLSGPTPYFYQLLGVCTGGLEGPIE